MSKYLDIGHVYNENVDDLYIYGLHLGFQRTVVLDAIHDVFCKLCADQQALQNVHNIKCYLMKSLKNRLIDIYNSDKNIILVDINRIAENEMSFFQFRNSVEDHLISKENEAIIKSIIDDMLKKLTPHQRQIIYLRYVAGCDYEQIARRMELSYASCRKLVHKAIKKLREEYDGDNLHLYLSLLLE